MQSPMKSRRDMIISFVRGIVCLTLIATAVGTYTATPAAATDQGGGLSVEPFSAPGLTKRPTFVYTLQPGQKQDDSVVVANTTDQPQTLAIYAANAFSTSTGKIGVRPNDVAKSGPVDWLHLSNQVVNGRLEFKPQSSATIPFTILVPVGTPPGDYAFGIAAAPTTAATPIKGKNSLQVITAVATLVLLRVPGPMNPSVRLDGLKIKATTPVLPGIDGGTTDVGLSIVNDGNQMLSANVVITEYDLFGSVIHTEPTIELPRLLPGSKVKFTRSWNEGPAIEGSIKVAITTDTNAAATRSKNFWNLGWATLIIPGAIVLLVLLLRWRRRRRRKRHAVPEPEPA